MLVGSGRNLPVLLCGLLADRKLASRYLTGLVRIRRNAL